ncbi:uncharacterized protein LOC116849454 [Odontomachus brunneus]|uniref:uncharacterized protein LOC116849454 n=1 Tax=Odontomachus brunneus TaxID=486640 RepID=UPI0013F28429|nr:uncharacterized protein LOC116849454 [Odontomachus brunneus]
MISQYVGKDHRSWDENLSQIKFAFNTAQNEGTGYTPAFLNNGRELAGPCELERKQRPGTTSTNIHEQLKDAYELVTFHMARAFQKQEKSYNLRRRAWKPHIGDIVWKWAHTLSNKEKAINSKLAPRQNQSPKGETRQTTMDVDKAIEELLTTWNETEAQALWDSLTSSEDTKRKAEAQSQAAGKKLPPGKRPPSDKPAKRKPAIACLKTPPTARIAQKKLQALITQQTDERPATQKRRPHIRPYTTATPPVSQAPPKETSEAQRKPDQTRKLPEIISDTPITNRIRMETRTPQNLRVDEVLSSLRRDDGSSTNTLEETARRLLEVHVPDDRENEDTLRQREIRGSALIVPDDDDAPLFTEVEIVTVAKTLKWGIFPSIWKEGSLRVFLKGEAKDAKDPKSYRPICLLSVIGKFFEKLLTKRLDQMSMTPGRLSDRQFGSMAGKSTEDAIVELRRMVFASKRRYVFALLFDIAGAFHNVWWLPVMEAWKRLDCPRNIFQLLRSYFSNRKISISFGDIRVSKVASRGCPQGSVLGPA